MKPFSNRKLEAHIKQDSKRVGVFFKGTLMLFLLIAFIAFGTGLYFFRSFNEYKEFIDIPNSESTEAVTVSVPLGSTSPQIADILTEAGVLKAEYKDHFVNYLKRSGEGALIQAGDFRIPKNLTIKELSTILQNAGFAEVWITLPEGLRKDEIAAIVTKEMNASGNETFTTQKFLELTENKEFINTLGLPLEIEELEGFLYPDKYRIALTSTEEDVIILLTKTFTLKVGEDVTYRDIVLASMLEREGSNPDEMANIADIINRRENEGWFLGIDATLLYHHKDWKHVLTIEDIDLIHDYNTYNRLGLPPTPICNPGIESINAARNPIENEYYFYIHDKTGQIHYGKTIVEHNNNINKYLY